MTVETSIERDPLARHSLSASEVKMMLHAERGGHALLAYRDRVGALDVFVLGDERRSATVGRHADMDLSIGWDAEVSGLHAEFQCLGGEWTIADDGLSRNGTFLNGQRVGSRQRLRDGDRLRVGQTVLVFKVNAATHTDRQTVAASTPASLELTVSAAQRRVLIALCRPYRDGTEFSTPATNQQIAEELCLSLDAVKSHLRALFTKFELAELPQNQKRARLVESALRFGLVSQRELG